MTDKHPFKNNPVDGIRCEEWEAWLADSLDGTLSEKTRAAFDAHGASCPACHELLIGATQGREWMRFLQEEPHVPPALVGKILDQTAGAGGGAVLAGASVAGGGSGVAVWQLPMRRSFQEMRLLMTVAMAFFSITLTLSLIGVKPGNVKLKNLSLTSLEHAAVRSFYGTKQKVVYTYENLRFLYEMDAQLRQLRQKALPGKSREKAPHGGARLGEPPSPAGSRWAVNEKVQSGGETARADGEKVVVKGPMQEERGPAERSKA